MPPLFFIKPLTNLRKTMLFLEKIIMAKKPIIPIISIFGVLGFTTMIVGMFAISEKAWDDKSVQILKPSGDIFYSEKLGIQTCFTKSKIVFIKECLDLTSDFENWCKIISSSKRIADCKITGRKGDSFYITVKYKFGNALNRNINILIKINKKEWIQKQETK